MPSDPVPLSLTEVRRKIDAQDDQILESLMARFQLVEAVRAAKANEPSLWQTPMRPAREAQILKRLIAEADGAVHPRLLVRLWRSIINESSRVQAPVIVHVSKKLAQNIYHQIAIRDYFTGFDVQESRDEAQALVQVNVNPADIAIVEITSPWIDAYLKGDAGRAQVIATLPAIKDAATPQLLVFAVAPQEASGDDETLLVSKGSLPRDFAVQPLWSVKNGSYRLSALAGFFADHDGTLVGLNRSNPGLGLKVVGRYCSAIEV
jgi:chorismate mutase / prephenate dehydratase